MTMAIFVKETREPEPLNQVQSFRFVDLFAGLGGFHLALGRLGGRCVFAAEWKEHLRDIYKINSICILLGILQRSLQRLFLITKF